MAREQLCEHSCSYRRNNDDDGSYRDNRDCHHEAPTNATDTTDATDAMDMEVATINRTADAMQVAENAADANGHDSQTNKPEKA